MLTVAIDGACRRNGKPDCTSSGGVFYHVVNASAERCGILSAYEYGSTNQRGELLALLKALDFILQTDEEDAYVVTDSEYIFNAMTKRWYASWHSKGWVTAVGDPIKNKDIWLEVKMLMDKCYARQIEPMFFHIKGHCIPFGRVTADNLLVRDSTGRALWDEVCKKFDRSKDSKSEIFTAAQKLSERNNGFELPENTFKRFVTANIVADAIATRVVDLADSSRER